MNTLTSGAGDEAMALSGGCTVDGCPVDAVIAFREVLPGESRKRMSPQGFRVE
jgi:hypothetical protein